jgi:4-amino-4-deoxy-L-arabinose transferase-like glycosyltransferase
MTNQARTFLQFAALVATLLMLVRFFSGFISPIPLQVDEAQYLGWSANLAYGYFSKPPLIAWVISLDNTLCSAMGINAIEGCARMGQSIALTAASLFSGLAAWGLFQNLRVSIATTLLLAVSPLFGFYSLFATTDAWLLLFWSLSLYLFINAIQQPAPAYGYWALCGFAVGLGLLAKYSMGIFVLSALLWLLMQRRLLSIGPWLAGLIAFIVFLPNLIWNAQTGFPTFAHHFEISQIDRLAESSWSFIDAVGSSVSFLAAQFLMIGPFALAAVLVTKPQLKAPKNFNAASPVQFLMVFALPMLVLIILQSFLSRAHANWAAPAFVSLAIYTCWLWFGQSDTRTTPLRNKSLFVASLLFGLSMNVLFIIGTKIAYHQPQFFEIRAVEKIRGWREAAIWAKEFANQNELAIIAQERSLLAALHAYGNANKLGIYAVDFTGTKRNHYTWFQNIQSKFIKNKNNYLYLSLRPPKPEELQSAGFRITHTIEDQKLHGILVGDQKIRIIAYEVSIE